MARFSWLVVMCACFAVSGCGPGSIEAPDEAEVKSTTPIEDDMKAAGMEGMSDADYYSGGNK